MLYICLFVNVFQIHDNYTDYTEIREYTQYARVIICA